MLRSVSIVALGHSRQEFDFDKNKDSDIWCVHLASFFYKDLLRRRDAVFEIHHDIWDLDEHAWKDFPKRKREEYRKRYLDVLVSLKCSVFMQFKDERIPNCKLYPFEKIVKKYGIFFDNTISLMLALAIEKGYEEIRLFGCDMQEEREKFRGRGVCEYYLGLAVGMGIKVSVPASSTLLVPFNPSPFEIYGTGKNASFFDKDCFERIKRYLELKNTQITDPRRGDAN